jgi:hypothetical protein
MEELDQVISPVEQIEKKPNVKAVAKVLELALAEKQSTPPPKIKKAGRLVIRTT